jgi:hypothetical protein
VTEGIVDILETVEVEQGHRYRPLHAIAGEQPTRTTLPPGALCIRSAS